MFTGTPTPFLKLPNYNPNDRPDFLTDLNYAFKKIDETALGIDAQLVQLQTEVANLNRMVAKLQELAE